MKIGILETGYRPESTIAEHGNYPQAFEKLLDGFGFTFENWAALEGELPDAVDRADGWLITGSKHGAYDDLPWIKPLEQFIVEIYREAIPMVGVCFGHQIIAQALGGRVEKFDGGWSVGCVEYQLAGIGDRVPLYAWHQDQVIDPPPDATPAGSTDFCQYAALSYGNRAYTVQPHPEFTIGYLKDLLIARKDVLPPNIVTQAEASLQIGPAKSTLLANKFAEFFLANKK